MSSHLSKQCLCLSGLILFHSIPVSTSDGPGDSTGYFRHPFQSFLISHPILIEVSSHPCDNNGPTTLQIRQVHSRPHPPAAFPSNAFSFDPLLFQSLPKQRILTQVASNPCNHNGPTSEPNKYKSTSTFASTSYTLYWQKFLLILATTMIPHRSPTGRVEEQETDAYSDPIPLSPPKIPHTDPSSVLCLILTQSILYWQKFLLILATIMTPHRSPTNTSRWVHSRRHPILTEVPQAMPFRLTPFDSSLSQRILYWQKFLLILATIRAPHRSPTNTNRRVHPHPHPPATFPSNAFSPDSLLFQSLPKHRILTEVASNPCVHNGPTSEPKYWQKLLLILATTMVPHRNPNTDRSCF